eukprot:TRINITY_DN35451_c0_g1_i1.p1 TRINITY_DN35451_c0_g1~~TRINITY_DN35451_c0_g1_i1.p1  ORF type:complete len:261 (-),score=35.90 TRINITY_DN35451_c0_g1_i1:126-908(-)
MTSDKRLRKRIRQLNVVLAALAASAVASSALNWVANSQSSSPEPAQSTIKRRHLLIDGAATVSALTTLTTGAASASASSLDDWSVRNNLPQVFQRDPWKPRDYFGGSLEEFTELKSGLRYVDIVDGDGERCCADGENAAIEWSLRSIKGQPIDSTQGFNASAPASKRVKPQTLIFAPNRLVLGIRRVGMRDDVVEGVREAVLGMRVGGTRRAVIPEILGWKDEDQVPMPLDPSRLDRLSRVRRDPLVFDLRLTKIEKVEK